MTPETTFLLVLIGMGLLAGPFYMRMLAHGAKPDEWWRGRRAGGLIVGLGLLIPGLIAYLIGGVGRDHARLDADRLGSLQPLDRGDLPPGAAANSG
jgi:hypothetical protein